MARSLSGFSKTERTLALLAILEKGGWLRAPELRTRLATSLNVPEQSLKDSLYADLSWLVDQGRIHVRYFWPNGELIEEYDSKIHRGAQSEWRSKELADSFQKKGSHAHTSSKWIIPTVLKNLIEVRDSFSPSMIHSGRVGVAVFTISGLQVFLSNSEDRPWTLHISRRNRGVEDEAIHAKIRTHSGPRSISLSLPVADLSSTQPNGRVSHVSLAFLPEKGTAEITDHGSKNGTFRIELSPKSNLSNVVSVFQQIGQTNEITQDHPFHSVQNQADHSWIPFEPHHPQKLRLPALIRIGMENYALLF